jgi:hypothetical protein
MRLGELSNPDHFQQKSNFTGRRDRSTGELVVWHPGQTVHWPSRRRFAGADCIVEVDQRPISNPADFIQPKGPNTLIGLWLDKPKPLGILPSGLAEGVSRNR